MAPVDLQSREHRDLLDIIDRLRLHGVHKYVDLPQVIVCGDQSAGKSSVLEAISRVKFPVNDTLCTRFPMELVLRRDNGISMKISINPAIDRSPEERKRISAHELTIDNNELDLGKVIEATKEAVGISDTKVYSKDVLRIEISGPTQPHLTIIDLPGMYRSSSQEQAIEHVQTVQDMVKDYMRSPRSIILAVVSAQNEYNLQDVAELAREVDPTGSRTLGIITKPDTLHAGSDSEKFFIKLASNNNVVLRLGWHVLVNRSFPTRDTSSDERDAFEADFLSRGAWCALDDKSKGVANLVRRLSNVLKDQILQHLPKLLKDVETGIHDCRIVQKRLGPSRDTLDEHRRYLFQISQDFSSLLSSAADGIYTVDFFGSAMTKLGYQKRLRAVVQNHLTAFAEEMRLRGQTRLVGERSDVEGQPGTLRISRAKYIDEVKVLMRRSRGRELPGTFSPMLVGELFAAQCKPWEGIAVSLGHTVTEAIHDTITLILSHVAPDDTAREVFTLVHNGIAMSKAKLDAKLIELLRPHLYGHPITYNHYLTDNVQKAQAARQRKDFESFYKRALNVDGSDMDKCLEMVPIRLLHRLQQHTEVNMERYASELAVDYMEAYYKVALKNFVDDVGTLAVEECLMRDLPTLFDPQVVYSLSEQDLRRLTAESEHAQKERRHCAEKLIALESAAVALRRLEQYKPQGYASASERLGDDHRQVEIETRSEHDEEQDDYHSEGESPINHSVVTQGIGAAAVPSDDWHIAPNVQTEASNGVKKSKKGKKSTASTTAPSWGMDFDWAQTK